MIEYPKDIQVNGMTVTVTDAADEAMWRGEYKPPQGDAALTEPEPEPEPVADPLDSVEVKMDNPDFAKPQTNEFYDLDTDTTKPKKTAHKKK